MGCGRSKLLTNKAGEIGLSFITSQSFFLLLKTEIMQRIKYSITINGPSEDAGPGCEQIHCSFALRDLLQLKYLSFPVITGPGFPIQFASADFPLRVINYFIACEEAGNNRAELLEGVMKYCMYIQPEPNAE